MSPVLISGKRLLVAGEAYDLEAICALRRNAPVPVGAGNVVRLLQPPTDRVGEGSRLRAHPETSDSEGRTLTPNRQGRSTALVMPIRCRPRRKVHRWQSKAEGWRKQGNPSCARVTANASVSRPGPEQSVFRSVATATALHSFRVPHRLDRADQNSACRAADHVQNQWIP